MVSFFSWVGVRTKSRNSRTLYVLRAHNSLSNLTYVTYYAALERARQDLSNEVKMVQNACVEATYDLSENVV
jgi:hypothetical protein